MIKGKQIEKYMIEGKLIESYMSKTATIRDFPVNVDRSEEVTLEYFDEEAGELRLQREWCVAVEHRNAGIYVERDTLEEALTAAAQELAYLLDELVLTDKPLTDKAKDLVSVLSNYVVDGEDMEQSLPDSKLFGMGYDKLTRASEIIYYDKYEEEDMIILNKEDKTVEIRKGDNPIILDSRLVLVISEKMEEMGWTSPYVKDGPLHHVVWF